MHFTFRRLSDDDLPMLHGWLNEPGIVQWSEGDDVSWEGIVYVTLCLLGIPIGRRRVRRHTCGTPHPGGR